MCVSERTDLIVVDYMMPGLNGVDFIKTVRANTALRTIPVIMITADHGTALRLEAIDAGATNFLTKPIDPAELRARAVNLLAVRWEQTSLFERAKSLEQDFSAAARSLLQLEEEILVRLSRVVECRNSALGDRVGRVGAIARIIGEELHLSPVYVRNLFLAAPLHDIGNVGLPDAILGRPRCLAPDEIALVRSHVDIGAALLKDSETDLGQMAFEIAANHHEKWDGTGYPKGLSGDAIPPSARIAAVSAVFDGLCDDRYYSSTNSLHDAYVEILLGAGGHFDPICVSAFASGWDRILTVIQRSDTIQAA